MIRRNEIDEKARQFEILPASVERDYVFGWLLFGVFTISALKDRFFLKGGNALRKGYYESTVFLLTWILGSWVISPRQCS
jgi:predicted nucleotidyltransferase component of viral defense system